MVFVNISNLSANYKKNVILDSISISIESNQCVCILGENSAGKSTLLKCICKLKKYTGDIEYKKDLKIFYLPQDNILLEDLSVEDNLKLLIDDYSKCNSQILEEFSLLDVLKKKVKDCSGGMKRKIALFTAFVQPYDLLILDEAFVGLDIDNRRLFLRKLSEFVEKGSSIIYTSHLNDTLEIANRKFYLKNGNLEEII